MDFPNVDGFIGFLLGSDRVTLHELRTVYTLEDAMDMWEVLVTNRFNEWLAYEEARK